MTNSDPILRVILVMPDAPLPFGSAPARWYYVLLKELVARGHEVIAFAACQSPEQVEQAKGLFPAPAYDLRCYPFPKRGGLKARLKTLRRPLSYMFSAELQADLERELTDGYDIFHMEQLWAGWLGWRHRERALLSVHYLAGIDLQDVRPASARQRVERSMMISGERRLLRRFRHIRCCTDRLKDAVRHINPEASVTAGPHGIDTALYPYIHDDRRPVGHRITLVGSMGWHPSRSAAERLLSRLWPAIHERVPDASVEIVGWGACEALAPFQGMPGVTILENVPDIRPFFERASVLVYAPARGSGMKIKVVEAFAFGVPVVTTSEGIEGIPAQEGVHVACADDDEALIEKTASLLLNRPGQNRQRRAARALIEAHCSPARTVDGIEAAYASVLGG